MGNFFKQTFASLIGSLAALLLFFIIGGGGFVLLLISLTSKQDATILTENSVLVFDLSTQITDTPPPSNLLSPEKSITLRQVVKAIDKATTDDKIVAIFLDGRGGGLNSGYASLAEIRSALSAFQQAGKQIIAYDVNLTEREYYLASVANSIILNPIGQVEINGFSSEQPFLTGALNKYGIGVQIIRVGDFKAAVEPFIRQDFSEENRQQTSQLLSDLWSQYLSTVTDSRQLEPEKLQAIANNQGLLNPEEALNQGLIDNIAYFDEILDQLKEITGKKATDKSLPQVTITSYGNLSQIEKSSDNKIAIVYAEGSIVNGEGSPGEIGGARFAKLLRKLRQEENVKAVVLRINTPGGSATASEIMLREIKLTNEKKPVIISMGNVAASGGYWIATGGRQIFAQESTITGSIGVFGVLFNIEEISNNNGITWDVVKTGKLANLGTISRPKTETELAIYQEQVKEIYGLFLEKVAEARGLSLEKVENIAQGRVWSGEAAKNIGLVDNIGGLEAAIEYAAEEAKLEDDWQIEEYPKPRNLEAEILEQLFNSELAKQDPLTAQFLHFKQDLALFININDPKNAYVLLPFNWRFD